MVMLVIRIRQLGKQGSERRPPRIEAAASGILLLVVLGASGGRPPPYFATAASSWAPPAGSYVAAMRQQNSRQPAYTEAVPEDGLVPYAKARKECWDSTEKRIVVQCAAARTDVDGRRLSAARPRLV
jgi:hypothetical protein